MGCSQWFSMRNTAKCGILLYSNCLQVDCLIIWRTTVPILPKLTWTIFTLPHKIVLSSPLQIALEKAYNILNVDYAVDITPSFFRSQFIKKMNECTGNHNRDDIINAYNSILSLIIKKDIDINPDIN